MYWKSVQEGNNELLKELVNNNKCFLNTEIEKWLNVVGLNRKQILENSKEYIQDKIREWDHKIWIQDNNKKKNGCQSLSYWQRLKELDIISLQRRRERYILICMWRILHGAIPNPNIQFRPRSRLGIQAVIPSLVSGRTANQSRYDSTFAVLAPKLWNALPSHLTTIESAAKFKNHLTIFLKNLE